MRRPALVRYVVVLALIASPCGAFAADACLVTPAELQAATGRAFSAGQAGKNAVDGAAQCTYAEQARPQRKLVIGVSAESAKQQFESRKRLLQMGKEPIDLPGVADGAYYNGTSAGVLVGDKLIAFSNVRRASDPKIEREKVATLLRHAVTRVERQ